MHDMVLCHAAVITVGRMRPAEDGSIFILQNLSVHFVVMFFVTGSFFDNSEEAFMGWYVFYFFFQKCTVPLSGNRAPDDSFLCGWVQTHCENRTPGALCILSR